MNGNEFIINEEQLYIIEPVMLAAGVPKGSLKNARTRNYDWLIDDPKDRRRNLYHYDDMPQSYREKIQNWLKSQTHDSCNCPHTYMALQPIRSMIKPDEKAADFYITYTYMLDGSIQHLTHEAIDKYTRNAQLLNMLVEAKADKKRIKKTLKISIATFFEKVIELIKADGYDLPKTYRNLIQVALKDYEAKSYPSIIHKNTGKQTSAKVVGIGKDMMKELLSHPNQYDDQFIKLHYNEWAKNNGLKPVTRATVSNKRKEYEAEIKPFREGWNEYNRSVSRSVQREAPSQPCYLWEGDDNHIDWWFRDNKNNIQRLKAYVVVDSFQGICYPLGWAFSENDITIETVRLAFLMAAHHIKELTGNYCLPHETKTDRWGLATLQPFYESLGHYYPTPKGSKNRGWLENFFGHADWQRSLKTNPDELPAPNYTGYNISAKNAGANLEALNDTKNLKLLPNIEAAGAWMAAHFQRLRTMPIGYEVGAPSRQQLWLEAWAQLAEDKKRMISEEQFLLKFGLRHDANGGNAITKEGVQPTINGVEYSYQVPPAYYLPNFGRKVCTYYNPFDMNRVLLTDGARLLFVAEHTTKAAGCMADMQDGGRSFLNTLIALKKADVDSITAARAARRDRLAAAGQDAEIVLKMGASVRKELKTAATEEYQLEDKESKTKKLPPYIPADDYEEDVEDNAAMAL